MQIRQYDWSNRLSFKIPVKRQLPSLFWSWSICKNSLQILASIRKSRLHRNIFCFTVAPNQNVWRYSVHTNKMLCGDDDGVYLYWCWILWNIVRHRFLCEPIFVLTDYLLVGHRRRLWLRCHRVVWWRRVFLQKKKWKFS